MLSMTRFVVVLACLQLSVSALAFQAEPSSLPWYNVGVARAHEVKPLRHNIPVEGIRAGFNQIHLTLTVSPTGDVTNAEANGSPDVIKHWPQVQGEVYQWKFTPFEKDGRAVTAKVEEYLELVPQERSPATHVTAPVVRPDSKVTISLDRSRCYGSCPSYRVSVGTNGIVFEGLYYVTAAGRHTAEINADEVRELAKRFVTADFYSMDARYRAGVTDNPTYVLSIEIDGQKKEVLDYVGSWVGMPAVISELEEAVDVLAKSSRWVTGGDGLVEALREERYDFHTYDAQLMLKEAASRGQAATMQEFIAAGVPSEQIPAPMSKEPNSRIPFENQGWLTIASGDAEALKVLIHAGVSRHDQSDKELALVGTMVRGGGIKAVRELIAYGADPNGDPSKLPPMQGDVGRMLKNAQTGSILYFAAQSGNPEIVREILRYHPKLEQRDGRGRTALFVSAADSGAKNEGPARAECVRLLAGAGADANTRDEKGNTPLHITVLHDVEEELLRLGADVNARNQNGETPIFTTIDNEAFPLFIAHGADLTIRNNQGQTVVEAVPTNWPQRREALLKAVAAAK